MHPVILHRVGKAYHLDAVDVPALQDITLDIRPDRFTVVSGPSGNGKTTLLNLIGCIDRPDSGEISVAGQPPGMRSGTVRRQLTGVIGNGCKTRRKCRRSRHYSSTAPGRMHGSIDST